MDYKDLQDDTLLLKLSDEDSLAFKEIYTRYWLKMFNAAYQRLNSKDAAFEIVQNVFVNIWSKKKSLHIQNLSAYLNTSVKNRVINFIEADITKKKALNTIYHQSHKSSVDVEETVDYNQLLNALHKALDTLPEKTRQVFIMSRLEKKSVREIAAYFQLSEKSIEYHITIATKHLKENLKHYQLICILILDNLFTKF